jgi:Zn-dependent peptidase ImmA (M78 family)/transcriptional regulator with XRE-family HTH domain
MTFNRSRLKEAREARGFTASMLADIANIAKVSVLRLEAGTQRPSGETVFALADALRVPIRYLSAEDSSSSEMPVFYRSLTSVRRATDIKMAERRLAWAQRIVTSLTSYVDLPLVTLPRFKVSSDPWDITNSYIDEIADECRAGFSLSDGAISNVGWLLENHGCIVVRNALGTDGIDAFSQYSKSGRPLIFLGRHSSSVRHQFDYAHELGHLVLHRNVDKRYLKDVTTYRAVEDQAHRFASSFLLPARSFSRSVGQRTTLNGLLALKADWLVSVGAMIKRCETLALVSKDEARTLWINYLKRGWKKAEPLDSELTIDPPQVLYDAIAALKDSDSRLFREWITELSEQVPPADVADITCCPEEWFRPNQIAPASFGVKMRAV